MSNYFEVGPDGHGGVLIRTDRDTALSLAEGMQSRSNGSMDWPSDVAWNIRTGVARFAPFTSSAGRDDALNPAENSTTGEKD